MVSFLRLFWECFLVDFFKEIFKQFFEYLKLIIFVWAKIVLIDQIKLYILKYLFLKIFNFKILEIKRKHFKIFNFFNFSTTGKLKIFDPKKSHHYVDLDELILIMFTILRFQIVLHKIIEENWKKFESK
jgi:hypothetical protein